MGIEVVLDRFFTAFCDLYDFSDASYNSFFNCLLNGSSI
jgi:hypothetical protein